MKKNKTVKIVAFLALFAIVAWVVWTWLAVIFSWETSENISTEITNNK